MGLTLLAVWLASAALAMTWAAPKNGTYSGKINRSTSQSLFFVELQDSIIYNSYRALAKSDLTPAKRHYMAVLKLDKYDEEKEIEFELDYLTSLTTQQRFELMFRKTQEMLSLRNRRKPRRKTTEIIKREPR